MRITTGFVEPHFFAGFSGGPKMVAPGLAGLETVLTLHDAARIGLPHARWGVTEGNPIHDDVRAIAAATGTSTSRSTSSSTGTSGSCAPSAASSSRCIAEACRAAGQIAMQPVADAVRRGRDVERGLPARPEPLPGRQGHVGRRAGGEARRTDRLRRGVSRRIPGHGSYPSSSLGRLARGSARSDHRSLEGRCPISGRCRSRPPSRRGRGWSSTRRTSRTRSSRPHTSSRPPTSRERWPRQRRTRRPRVRAARGPADDPLHRLTRCTSSRRPTSFATR